MKFYAWLQSIWYDWQSATVLEYFLLLVICILIFIVYKVIYGRVNRWRMGLPFVEGGYPFVGQVFTMIKGSPWDTMAQWVNHYGTVYCFHLFGEDAVAVADSQILEMILQTKLKNFRKDVHGTYKPFMVLLGKGLVTSEDNEWRRQRTLVSHALRIEILKDIPRMAVEALSRLCVRLDAVMKKNETIDMAEEFRHLTLQVIAKAILSVSPEESDKTFAHMYLPIVEEGHKRTWNPLRSYIPNSDFWKFQKDVKELNDYVTHVIKERYILRKEEKLNGKPITRRPDILDKTMGAIDDKNWNDAAVEQIRDEVKTFILAGHETSASMLTWSLFELTQNSDIMQKVK
jgi:cytochrome P450